MSKRAQGWLSRCFAIKIGAEVYKSMELKSSEVFLEPFCWVACLGEVSHTLEKHHPSFFSADLQSPLPQKVCCGERTKTSRVDGC